MDKIKDILLDIEKKNQIKIIYAVEAGSRAWGIQSENSEFDIRFIFIQNDSKKYLSLRPIKETIEGFSDGRKYDWQGWDITKALKLIERINPSLTEWIYSPIVYLKAEIKYDFLDKMKELLNRQCRISPLLQYYRSLAKANYKGYIISNDNVIIKKYLYVIRPVAMCEWLLKCHKSFENSNLINVNFNQTLEELKPYLNDEIYANIQGIIEIKKSRDIELKPRVKCIDEWIEKCLENDEIKKKEDEELEKNKLKKDDLNDFDDILHSILGVKFD